MALREAGELAFFKLFSSVAPTTLSTKDEDLQKFMQLVDLATLLQLLKLLYTLVCILMYGLRCYHRERRKARLLFCYIEMCNQSRLITFPRFKTVPRRCFYDGL